MTSESLQRTERREGGSVYTCADSPDRRAVVSEEGNGWRVNIQRRAFWWQAEDMHENQPRYATLEEAEAAVAETLTAET